ncbi:MAG: prolipoprotein diacylglyceryl transferase family protein, partial [Bacteroidota bacterium]
VFGHSLIEILENTQGIESVAIEASDQSDLRPEETEFSSDESPYRPITATITFEEASYQEAEIRNYLETQVKSIMTRYASVREHIYEPSATPLNYELSQQRGAYVAEVQTFGIPRHPAQLYESGTTFLVFLLLLFLWSQMKEKTPEGLFLGLFLIFVFGLRFVHEFFKENQVDWEGNLPLNMGQWLSIPLVLIGLYLLFVVVPKNRKKAAQAVKS